MHIRHTVVSVLCAIAILAVETASVISGDGHSADPHLQLNPLYRELQEQGVAVGAKLKPTLPAPLFGDKLNAKQQSALLAKLAGDDYPLDELLRPSVVAPFVFKFGEFDTHDPTTLGRRTDLWFIAYGKLESLTHDNLTKLYKGVLKDSQPLKDALLKERGLKRLDSANAQEEFFHTSYPLLNRVRVHATFRTVSSRHEDSVVLASRLDAAFNKDKEFPNQWRPLEADEAGNLKPGPPQPYEGVGAYLRISRLQEPQGALFVELHQVFAEPTKWFDVPNVLRSKLPIVVLSEVRTFRRELLKLAKP
ncbi:MAG: hypothetical protein L0Y72_03645 [Gemmataceae bacterium]|nr:hypothetical protein [Gemmataceae bacterium]